MNIRGHGSIIVSCWVNVTKLTLHLRENMYEESRERERERARAREQTLAMVSVTVHTGRSKGHDYYPGKFRFNGNYKPPWF